MMAINVEDSVLQQLAQGFGCQVGTLPFTYLGLAVGTTKPSIQELSPIVHRLERRLTATSCFLELDYSWWFQLFPLFHYICYALYIYPLVL